MWVCHHGSKLYTGKLHTLLLDTPRYIPLCDHFPDVSSLTSELRVVIGQLVRPLHVEHRFLLVQGAVLWRLEPQGRRG